MSENLLLIENAINVSDKGKIVLESESAKNLSGSVKDIFKLEYVEQVDKAFREKIGLGKDFVSWNDGIYADKRFDKAKEELAEVIIDAIVSKGGNEALQNLLGYGSIAMLQDTLPSSMRGLEKIIRNRIFHHEAWGELDNFDKKIVCKDGVLDVDVKEIKKFLENIDSNKNIPSEVKMMLQAMWTPMILDEKGIKNEGKTEIENEDARKKFEDLIALIESDEKFGFITKADFEEYFRQLKEIYNIKNLTKKEKEVIEKFRDDIYGRYLDKGYGDTPERKNRESKEAVGSIPLDKIFEAYGIVSDSLEQVKERVDVLKIDKKDNDSILLVIEEYGICLQRLELLKKKVSYNKNISERNRIEKVIDLEIKKLLFSYEPYLKSYANNQRYEWEKLPKEEKQEKGEEYQFVGPPKIKAVLAADGTEISGEVGGDEEEKLFDKWLKELGYPGLDATDKGEYTPEDYKNFRKRFRQAQIASETEGQSDDTEREWNWWRDFKAFIKAMDDELQYQQGSLYTVLMPEFPRGLPPKEIRKLIPGYERMKLATWEECAIVSNDILNAVCGMNSVGNKADLKAINERAGMSLYICDIKVLNEMPAYRVAIEDLYRYYFKKSTREDSLGDPDTYLVEYTEQGQKDLINKDRSQMKKEAYQRLKDAIKENKNGRYDDLQGLLENDKTRLFLDLAFKTAWNFVYMSNSWGVSTPFLRPILKEELKYSEELGVLGDSEKYYDPSRGIIVDRVTGEQAYEKINAGAQKKMSTYGMSLLRPFHREWKKWRLFEYYDPKTKKHIRVGGDQEVFGGPFGEHMVKCAISGNIEKRKFAVGMLRKIAKGESAFLPSRLGFSLFDFMEVTSKKVDDKGHKKLRKISYSQALLEDVGEIDVPMKIIKVENGDDIEGNKKDTNYGKRYTTAENQYCCDFVMLLLGKMTGASKYEIQQLLHDIRTISLNDKVPFKNINKDPRVIAAILLQTKGVAPYAELSLAGARSSNLTYTEDLRRILNEEFDTTIGIEHNDPDREKLIRQVIEYLHGGKDWLGEKYRNQRARDELYYTNLVNNPKKNKNASWEEAIRS